MYGWKTEDQFLRMENAGPEIAGPENAEPEKGGPKREQVETDHSRSYNKAKHSCIRRTKATEHPITLRKTTQKHFVCSQICSFIYFMCLLVLCGGP